MPPSEREHETFGDQLAHHAGAAAADRETNGKFLGARAVAREQHVGEVERRDEEHHEGHAEQNS